MSTVLGIATLGERCCGCGACSAKCPKGAISMRPDSLGFLHPSIDLSSCVGCMSCDKVCPSLNGSPKDTVREAWWAQANNDRLLGQSSSGGVFGLLAERMLADGGVVCGAAWSGGCKSVRHALAATEDEVSQLRRSKYVQSSIGRDIYAGVHDAIRDGRPTLFVGTACQVSAVRAYLGRLADSPLFLSVDIICHGVPSRRLWEMWLAYLSDVNGVEIDGVNFRSKSTGWLTYSVAYYAATEIVRETLFTEDWFFEAFQKNASLRGSCLHCPSKRSCGSDITLGDFWGFQNLHPEVDCSGGISAVICNTEKGAEAFSSLSSLSKGPATYEEILQQNRCLSESSIPYSQRKAFLSDISESRQMKDVVSKWRFSLTVKGRIRRKLASIKRVVVHFMQLRLRRLS